MLHAVSGPIDFQAVKRMSPICCINRASLSFGFELTELLVYMAKDVDQDAFDLFKRQYGAVNGTPMIPNNTAALKFPAKKMTVSQQTKQLHLNDVKAIRVPGLVDHMFPKVKSPIEFDDTLISSLESIKAEMPDFVFDKRLDKLSVINDQIKARATGEAIVPRDSQEIQFANWINKFSECMWAYAKSKGITLPLPRSWDGQSANKVITNGSTKQKPDLILYEPKETKKKCFESIRVVWEITTEEDFPDRTTDTCDRRTASMLKMQPGRLFVPLLLMLNSQVGVTLYDRVGIWESDAISLSTPEGRQMFYRVIAFCAFADPKYLGFDPNIDYIDHIPRYINIPRIGDKETKIMYKIFKVLFVEEGLTGSGVVHFFVGRGQEFFTVKQIWQDLSRIAEFVHFADAVQPLDEICLPHLKGGTIASIEGENIVTASFRPKPSRALHDRILLRYLYQPVGKNIVEFSSKIELLSVLLDIVWGMFFARNVEILLKLTLFVLKL